MTEANYGSRAMKDRVYTPRPLPQNIEDFNAYFADEFAYLGGFIDKILSGQSIPYRSELPPRVKDGMVIYFKNAIKDKQTTDDRFIIPAAGLYVFKGEVDETKPVGGSKEPILKGGSWLQLIEDPESLTRHFTAYLKVPEGQSVTRPPANKYKPTDILPWVYNLPVEESGFTVYRSEAIEAYVGNPPEVNWEEPVPFKVSGIPGSSTELRFIASTDAPVIADPLERNPVTTQGEPFLKTLPNIVHPGKDFYWLTVATTRDTVLLSPWETPVKFSTPDSTREATAYQVAVGNFTDFNSEAEGLPGSSWSQTPPPLTSGKQLWKSTRLEWTNGVKQTSWSIPVVVSTKEKTMDVVSATVTMSAPTSDLVTEEIFQTSGLFPSFPYPRTLSMSEISFTLSGNPSGETTGTIYGDAYTNGVSVLLVNRTEGTYTTIGNNNHCVAKLGIAPNFPTDLRPTNGTTSGILPSATPRNQYPMVSRTNVPVLTGEFVLEANKEYDFVILRRFWIKRTNAANIRLHANKITLRGLWFKN